MLRAGMSMVTKCFERRQRVDKPQTARWIAITIVDAITEIATFVVFCVLMSSLQMQNRLKVTVSVLLAFRLG